MTIPKRIPPGPVKKYTGYFTIPISEETYAAMETLKWRVRYDKTEIARRLLEYFLALPEDSQDKLLGSFDMIKQQEKVAERMKRNAEKVAKRKLMQRLKAESINGNVAPKPINVSVKEEYVSPERNLVMGKRSGLP